MVSFIMGTLFGTVIGVVMVIIYLYWRKTIKRLHPPSNNPSPSSSVAGLVGENIRPLYVIPPVAGSVSIKDTEPQPTSPFSGSFTRSTMQSSKTHVAGQVTCKGIPSLPSTLAAASSTKLSQTKKKKLPSAHSFTSSGTKDNQLKPYAASSCETVELSVPDITESLQISENAYSYIYEVT